MLEFMVNLTSWVIRAGGAIAMLIGLYGLIQLFRGEFLWGIAGIITGIVFIVILGGVAVAFRISEQLDRLMDKTNRELKSISSKLDKTTADNKSFPVGPDGKPDYSSLKKEKTSRNPKTKFPIGPDGKPDYSSLKKENE